MLEMEIGITTSKGSWYRISREGIEKYVPGLLEIVSLERIIKTADDWIDSANGISLVLYLLLVIFGADPLISAAAAILLYIFWYRNTPAISFLSLSPVIRILNNDGLLYTAAGSCLIYLAYSSQFTALWISVVMLFLLKVRLMSLLADKVQSTLSRDQVSRADRLLNMILIRFGMREGKLSGNVQNMQDELLRIANYHRKKKDDKS